MLYRQFAEALVRAAHVKYHNLPGLDRRVNKLVTEHLLPGEAPGALDSLPWDDAMSSEEVKTAVKGRVQGAFAGIATDEAKPPAVTARAFLAFLKKAGALSDGEPAGTPVEVTKPKPAAGAEGSEKSSGDGSSEEGSEEDSEEGGSQTKDGEEGGDEAAAAVEPVEPEPTGKVVHSNNVFICD